MADSAHGPESSRAVGRGSGDLSAARDPGGDGSPAAGHDDHAEHGGEALGPIDWEAWGAAALGVVVSVIVAGAFYLAVNPPA